MSSYALKTTGLVYPKIIGARGSLSIKTDSVIAKGNPLTTLAHEK